MINLSLTVGSGAGNVMGISGTLTDEELKKLQSMKIPSIFTNGNKIAFFGIGQNANSTYEFKLMLYQTDPQGAIIVYSNDTPVEETINIKALG